MPAAYLSNRPRGSWKQSVERGLLLAPNAANALQEGLGGQFGEMRTMMQYLFQSFNARGDARPYKAGVKEAAVEQG